MIGQQQIVISLKTIGFLSALINFDHPSPNRTRCILEGGLVEEVARAMGGFVLLQRVIGEMLFVLSRRAIANATSRHLPGIHIVSSITCPLLTLERRPSVP